MIAQFTITDANGEVIERHKTDNVRTADLIARALAFKYPGADVQSDFIPA